MRQNKREIPKYTGLPLNESVSHESVKRINRARRNGGNLKAVMKRRGQR
jgi:hypothetical protein